MTAYFPSCKKEFQFQVDEQSDYARLFMRKFFEKNLFKNTNFRQRFTYNITNTELFPDNAALKQNFTSQYVRYSRN